MRLGKKYYNDERRKTAIGKSRKYLSVFIHLNSVQESLEQIALTLQSLRQDVLAHILPDVGTPRGDLPHGQAHQRHHPGHQVHHPSVVHLPEDLVKLLHVLVVLGVVVGTTRGITEIVVEDIAARLV